MKKITAFLLTAVLAASVFCAPAFAANTDDYGTRVTISGKTVKSKNKTVLKKINVLRKKANLPGLTMKKFKQDKELTNLAYIRAAMLAVYYGSAMPTAEYEDVMPEKVVVSKGSATTAYKAIKKSGYISAPDVNSVGIANLKIGSTTFWAAVFDYELRAQSVTDYSSETAKYSKIISFEPGYLKIDTSKNNYTEKVALKPNGSFAGKAVYLKNANSKVKNSFKIKNTSSAAPISFTTTNADAATVDQNGKVKAHHASVFRKRGSYSPKKGDFILFKWAGATSKASHVGIVYNNEGGTLTTIEGNADGLANNKSHVVKKKYENFSKNTSIIGFMDMSEFSERATAEKMAELAKDEIGNMGKKYCEGVNSWVEGQDEWCAIFCAWLMEQNGIDPASVSWYASCSMWVTEANNHAKAYIRARILGSRKYYKYKVTVN